MKMVYLPIYYIHLVDFYGKCRSISYTDPMENKNYSQQTHLNTFNKKTRGGLVVFTFSVCWLKASLWSKHVHTSNLGVHLSEMFKVTKKASHLKPVLNVLRFFLSSWDPKTYEWHNDSSTCRWLLPCDSDWVVDHWFFESCQTKYSTQHPWASKHLGFGGIWIPETYIKHRTSGGMTGRLGHTHVGVSVMSKNSGLLNHPISTGHGSL